jgi:hypothetical protein
VLRLLGDQEVQLQRSPAAGQSRKADRVSRTTSLQLCEIGDFALAQQLLPTIRKDELGEETAVVLESRKSQVRALADDTLRGPIKPLVRSVDRLGRAD